MREILFRGKELKSGKWVEGAYFPENDIYPVTIFCGKHHSVGHYVDGNTVGQYTGLTDKNGNKIFEGDIVIAEQERNKDVCRVGYENGAFVLYPQNGRIYEKTLWEYWYNDWGVEVVGNIHDDHKPPEE